MMLADGKPGDDPMMMLPRALSAAGAEPAFASQIFPRFSQELMEMVNETLVVRPELRASLAGPNANKLPNRGVTTVPNLPDAKAFLSQPLFVLL